MSKLVRAVLATSLLLTIVAATALAAGCGSSGGSAHTPAASPAVTKSATPKPAPSATDQSLRAEVHAYAKRMMADIKAAEDRGDVIDGTPVGASSNPYDYVGVSPVFVKIVALGKPALPAIAAEIVASDAGRPARVPPGRRRRTDQRRHPRQRPDPDLEQRQGVGGAVPAEAGVASLPTPANSHPEVEGESRA